MNRIVGLIMLGIFGFLGYKYFNTTEENAFVLRDYIQLVLTGSAALYLLVFLELENILPLINTDDNTEIKLDKTITKSVKSDKDIRYYDYICLSYLRDRCQDIESEEALGHILELNTILFKSKINRD